MNEVNILFVDDEKGFVETMEKRLSKRNINVLKAYDGDEAISQLAEHPEISVVVLDMKMPGRDGLDVLKEISRDFPLQEVIMLTGHATVESAITGMQNGAFDYLMKPCDLNELVTKIREAADLTTEHVEEAVKDRVSKITQRAY